VLDKDLERVVVVARANAQLIHGVERALLW